MKGLYVKFLRMLVHSIGKWSDGISMCLKHGLTSGIMLEYIYRNRASGKSPIGKLIDRIYLSHRGWTCIRLRKENLELLLQNAIENVLKNKTDVFMVDVASGPARYILNTLLKYPGKNVRALCRDLDQRWLEEGRKNAAAAGIQSVLFEKGDALDKESFRNIPAPDIMVSSGFYDWITDDELIKKSMQIAYDLLKPDGYFVFTAQTGHVNMQLVSEIFPDFNNQPLRMTIWPKETMLAWAKELGFLVIDNIQDRWGYYTVMSVQKK